MIRKAPKVMEPLLSMAGSGEVSPDDLRARLAAWDKAQLERNGFHLLQAVARDPSLAAVAMKFAVVHEALGSMSWCLWTPLTATLVHRERHARLSDEEAVRFSTYVLDVLGAKTYPGLVFQACSFGLVNCAKLFKDRGLYVPLRWSDYSGFTEEDRVRFVRTLLEAVNPPAKDLVVIGGALSHGSPAAEMLSMATAEPAGMVH